MRTPTTHPFRSRLRQLAGAGAASLALASVIAAPNAMADTTPPAPHQTQTVKQHYVTFTIETATITGAQP